MTVHPEEAADVPARLSGEELRTLGERLETQIARALDKDDWDAVDRLTAGVATELTNHGLTALLQAQLQVLQPMYDEDNERLSREVTSAVVARDAVRVRAALAEKTGRHQTSHWLYTDLMAQLINLTTTMFGIAGLERHLSEVGEKNRPMFAPMFEAGARTQVEGFSKALRAHLGTITVTEDDDRFTIRQDPCGSGGRMMRAGAFDGPDSLARVSSGGALTVGRNDFPSYCTHCPVWLGRQHLEWFDTPLVHEPPLTNGDPCIQHIYKSADRVPAQYVELMRRPDLAPEELP